MSKLRWLPLILEFSLLISSKFLFSFPARRLLSFNAFARVTCMLHLFLVYIGLVNRIRTDVRITPNGFAVRCLRPLSHHEMFAVAAVRKDGSIVCHHPPPGPPLIPPESESLRPDKLQKAIVVPSFQNGIKNRGKTFFRLKNLFLSFRCCIFQKWRYIMPCIKFYRLYKET